MQYRYYEKANSAAMEQHIVQRQNYIVRELEGGLMMNVAVIESMEVLIHSVEDPADIEAYLHELLAKTPAFKSLYFGTPENHMINGSGWTPSDDFDLRIRPWYQLAIESDQVITTKPYLNASKDVWTVTVAKAVYDSDGQLLGVVAGDHSLKEIIGMLKKHYASEHGFTFLLDRDHNVIMHSMMANFENTLSDENVFFEELELPLLTQSDGIKRMIVTDRDGYVVWNTVEGTGWVIGSFTPKEDFSSYEVQIKTSFGMMLLITAMLFGFLIYTQRQYILSPMIDLSREIQDISLDCDRTHRIALKNDDPFLSIRKEINGMLSETEDFFNRMREHRMALSDSESRMRAIVDVLPDLIFIHNHEGIFMDCVVNDESKLYAERSDFIGKSVLEVMPGEIGKLAMTAIDETIRTGEMQMFEYSLEVAGTIQYFEARLMKSSESEVLSMIRNITKNREYLKRIEFLSFHDELTDLYNRRYYEEKLQVLDVEENLPLTLALIDVNGLKLTNDAFGHMAGDKLLKSVAAVLKKHGRADDIVARIGGDEFILLLPSTTSEKAEMLVDRIQHDVSKVLIEEVPISISIGWETKYEITQPVMDIFVAAEDHMYRKKIRESQSMRNMTIQVILKTLNTKNEREKIHSENVSRICCKIGEALHMGYEDLKDIEISGLMHDIGKIAINESLLNKPGQLTEAEYIEVKKHPEIGYQILKSVDAYSGLAENALSHHERWDGGGYPRGLKGDEIPLFSRIIAVADAYEAMVSDRSYRKGMSQEKAIEEITRCSGTQFDPEIVVAFLSIADAL